MSELHNDTDLGASPNPADERRKQLAALIPEAFSEGRLDVAALKRALGEHAVIEGGERYALNWAGKSDAYRVLQTPSTATLRPQRDQSVNFDTAQHVFIEGENLEVLKVLQKAYFGKVKLIYIDPPYNTGSDSFIYPDRFQESKEDYLRRINDLNDDGTLMREGFFRKNSKENGHYHSNWLSMMLPRLYIARNLLREDGVIFVSCDDHEVHNLRCLMNEVFGDENFVATVIWQKVYSPKNSARHFSEDHDYVVVYARRAETWQPALLPRTGEMEARYDNPDDDPRGPWKPGDLSARNYYGEGTYAITCPSGRVIDGPPSGRYWAISKDKLLELDADKRIWWGKDGNNVPAIKRFLSEVKHGRVPQTLWKYEEVGHTQEAKKELVSLVDFPNSDAVFDTPKPTRLIRQMLRLGTDRKGGDIVLDFFGGSATTLQAVLEQNAEDGGDRRCVVVQLPEPVEGGSQSLRTIADIARTRGRNAIASLRQRADLATPVDAGLGFKAFTLAPSNFKQWRGDGIDTAEQLAEQIQLFAKSEKDGAAVEDMLYELLLKFGQELTTPIEPLEVAGGRVFAIHERKMIFVLESFSEAMIDPLVAMKPREIIAIDGVFNDSDMLKTNLDLQCRDAGIRFTCL
ncbi:site-specific DNA-methyltransferase [Zoogloeaceae bacteirum Par-f-2]|nr:site-specific DNA-methyltransferase [Rhodocyclaceae bacterium]AVZ79205.1 site-specific DNA-methyltransferase [Zoogloeaceae bacteirum Par-f-2]